MASLHISPGILRTPIHSPRLAVLAPGYHVNLSIDEELVIDRKTLTDQVPSESTVYIFQALTGG